ncbi:hypothetical protein Chor_005026 [Crotalus horridus]
MELAAALAEGAAAEEVAGVVAAVGLAEEVVVAEEVAVDAAVAVRAPSTFNRASRPPDAVASTVRGPVVVGAVAGAAAVDAVVEDLPN